MFRLIRRNLWISVFLVCCMAVSSCGLAGPGASGGAAENPEPVSITIWCSDLNMQPVKEAMEAFAAAHRDAFDLHLSYGEESEVSCSSTVLANPRSAADVFFFADDQLEDLLQAGALLEITENASAVIDAAGGKDSGAAKACMRNGKLYACPLAAGNGYFLYYRPSYFSKTDIATMDGLLSAAEKAGKKVTMDLPNGWYLYSFFKGAGLELEYDRESGKNSCDWNATSGKYTGRDVAEAILHISASDGFISLSDDEMLQGAADGSVIAAVSGAWNLDRLKSAWGEDLDAVKLPTYTLNGDQVQMCSFTGYKLAGVSAFTEHPALAMEIAQYLTAKDFQLKRFALIGECPANVEAAASPEVQASPVTRALAEQAQFGYTQNVGDAYWDASMLLGTELAAGNPDSSDLQTLLDRMADATEEGK